MRHNTLRNALLFTIVFSTNPELAAANLLQFVTRFFAPLSDALFNTLSVTQTGSSEPYFGQLPYRLERDGVIHTERLMNTTVNGNTSTALVASNDLPFSMETKTYTYQAPTYSGTGKNRHITGYHTENKASLYFMQQFFDCLNPAKIEDFLKPIADLLIPKAGDPVSTCPVNAPFNGDNIQLSGNIGNVPVSGCTAAQNAFIAAFNACSSQAALEARNKAGMIAGIVVGTVAFLVIATVISAYCNKKRNASRDINSPITVGPMATFQTREMHENSLPSHQPTQDAFQPNV
jgi:hypothetical protein